MEAVVHEMMCEPELPDDHTGPCVSEHDDEPQEDPDEWLHMYDPE